MRATRNFASDNSAGAHPIILEAIRSANVGHVLAYGDDPYTARAVAKFREHFGDGAEVYFVFGGTAANTLGLGAVTDSFNAVVCAETAHINVDECGAPEKFAGCKLLAVASPDGKLTPELVRPHLRGTGDQHHVQPRVISVAQSTEKGTVYRPRELEALSEFARRHGLLLHMDGARLSNAAARLGLPLRALTADAGVDLLSFGGTKNGMLFGEAVVFFREGLAGNFKFIRKQGMQLASKMRFISAQFEALLTDDLWRESAAHANRMADLLADGLGRVPQIKITGPVEANAVFALIPAKLVPEIRREYFFHVWDEETSEVRLMTSFDTTETDVRSFLAHVERAAAGAR